MSAALLRLKATGLLSLPLGYRRAYLGDKPTAGAVSVLPVPYQSLIGAVAVAIGLSGCLPSLATIQPAVQPP
jgi:hypothetical protein